MYGILLFLHIISATVWTGGHLVLSLAILPRAFKEQSTEELKQFESAYERVGIPALLIQVITGLWLAYRLAPDLSQWFSFNNMVLSLIGTKLILLALTLGLAIDARFRIIPKLSLHELKVLAWHIIPVTILSVLFVVVGVLFRTGWFF